MEGHAQVASADGVQKEKQREMPAGSVQVTQTMPPFVPQAVAPTPANTVDNPSHGAAPLHPRALAQPQGLTPIAPRHVRSTNAPCFAP